MDSKLMYSVDVEGFEKQSIRIRPAGLFLYPIPKLFIDGVVQVRIKGPAGKHYLITKDDGTNVYVSFKNPLLGFDPVPQMMVEEKTYRVVDPLIWYQAVWSSLSILVLIMGGAIGGLFAALAFTINIRLFHSNRSGLSKYLLSGAVSLLAVIITFIVALFLNGYINI